ncbi:hypothetical protein OKW50_000090 [Paraburkholderia youngii]|uniref:hypothetical protein n=1 Tax=Paraburkholderia youngii TaxID=2782701 RepID=UPI003D22AF65
METFKTRYDALVGQVEETRRALVALVDGAVMENSPESRQVEIPTEIPPEWEGSFEYPEKTPDMQYVEDLRRITEDAEARQLAWEETRCLIAAADDLGF